MWRDAGWGGVAWAGVGGEGGRVIAMLPDHDDAVDRELGAAAAQGQVDRGVDRHPVLLRQLLADVARAPYFTLPP